MALLGSIQEAFTNTSTPTGWTLTQLGSATATQDSTGVTINLPASTTSSTDGDMNYTATNDLTGSFARINVLGVSGASATHTDNVLRVRQNASNYYTMFYEAGTLYFSKVVAGGQTNIASIAHDLTAHAWWQIRHKGATVYGEYSSDGKTWTQLGSDPTAITITAVDVLIGAICFGVDTNPSAFKFKYFNYPQPGTTTSTSSTSASTFSTSSTSSSISTTSSSISSTSRSTSTSSTSSSISSTSMSTSSTSTSTSSTSSSSTSASTSISSTSSSISSTSSSTSVSSTSSSISSTSSSISSTSASTSSTSFSSTSTSTSASTTTAPVSLNYSYQDFATSSPDTSNSVGTQTTSPLTWSHTIGKGLNRVLAVAIAVHGSTQGTTTAVTFNGISMTKARGDQGTNAGAGWAAETSIWLLHNPPIGTYTVSATVTVPTNPDISGASMSYFGAEQTSTPDNSTGATGTTSGFVNIPITPVESSALVIGVFDYIEDNSGQTVARAVDTRRQYQAMSIGLDGALITSDTNGSVNGPKTMTYFGRHVDGSNSLYVGTVISIAPSIVNGNSLINPFTNSNYKNVLGDDGDYFIQYGSEFMIQEYKYDNTNNTDSVIFTWRGRTTVPTTTSPFLVQVYNITSAQWETLARETRTPADTDFQIQVTQSANLSNYYDSNNIVTFRTFQQVI